MCEDFSLLKELKIPSLDWGQVPQVSSTEYRYWQQKIPWLGKFISSDFYGDRVMADLIITKLVSDERLQYQESYDALNNNKLDKKEIKTSVARLANFAIKKKKDKK